MDKKGPFANFSDDEEHVIAVLMGSPYAKRPGSFTEGIILALQHADHTNMAKMEIIFPGLVAAVRSFKTDGSDNGLASRAMMAIYAWGKRN